MILLPGPTAGERYNSLDDGVAGDQSGAWEKGLSRGVFLSGFRLGSILPTKDLELRVILS